MTLDDLIQNVINSGAIQGGIGGAVAGSDLNPILKGLIGTALAPASNPSFETGYLPGGPENYAYSLAKWATRRADELDRLGQTQQAQQMRQQALLAQQQQQYQQNYQPTAAEQNLTQYGGNLQDILQSMYTQNTPEYQSRVDRAERERIAGLQGDLQQLVAANQRNIARGGLGTLNPERQDETIARLMARGQDTARDQAHGQVMSDLAQVYSGGLAGFAPQSELATRERSLQNTALGANMQNALQQEALTSSGENFMNDLIGKWQAAEPDPYNIQNQYRYVVNPSGGVTTGGGAGGTGTPATASGGGSILSQLLGMGGNYISSLFSGGTTDTSGNLINFPTTGSDTSGIFDPGYGYGAP